MSIKTLLMSAATAALLTGAASAQETTTETGDMSGDMQTTTGQGDAGYAADANDGKQITSLEEMTVGDVLGMQVFNEEAESIGEIDYVISEGDGAAAVIGIGGFLGLGEYTVALPLEQFKLNSEEWSLVVDRSKDELKEQPEFDESGAESLPDETPVSDLLTASADGDASGESMESDSADDMGDEAGDGADASDDMNTDGAEGSADASGDGDMATDADAGADAEAETDGADAETEGEAEAGAEAEVDAEMDAEGTDTEADVDAEVDAEAETEGEEETTN